MNRRNPDKDSKRHCPNCNGDTDQSRGQLILIGVISIGMLLIGMTIVMNGFLYAQNVESEGVPTEVSNVESIQHMVSTQYSELLIQSNIHDSDPHDSYSIAANNAQTAIRTQEATARGNLLNISKKNQTKGVLIRQSDGGNFTDGSDSSWSMTTSAVRRFQVAVNQSSLESINSVSEPEVNESFHIVVGNDTETWTVYITTKENTGIIIAVKDENGLTERYNADESVDSLTVDLVTGSINESDTGTVDEVALYDDEYAGSINDKSETYDISIENPEKAEGEYTLTARNDEHFTINGSFNSPGTSPYKKDVIYDSYFNITYRSSTQYYSGKIRIAPCSEFARSCPRYIRPTGGSS